MRRGPFAILIPSILYTYVRTKFLRKQSFSFEKILRTRPTPYFSSPLLFCQVQENQVFCFIPTFIKIKNTATCNVFQTYRYQ
jgi:hypothetical protein